MEFHLPYYVLRHSSEASVDDRIYRIRGKRRSLRRFSQLPTSLSDPQTKEFIYEAQISFLISGFDEWFWKAYCFVDTFFFSENSLQSYHEQGLDAASGGERYADLPVWNPREYFLLVLARRFRQVTKEWSVLVNTLDARLEIYVG